jgi:hypothetical protein
MGDAQAQAEATRVLTSVFISKEGNGALRFSEDDVLNYLPLLFMQAAQAEPEFAAAKHVERFLSEFASRIGVGPNTPPEEATQKLAAHYRAYPVNPALQSAFEQALREQTAAVTASALQRLAELSGERASLEGYRADRTAPEGTLPAGPLARFRAPGFVGPKKNGA